MSNELRKSQTMIPYNNECDASYYSLIIPPTYQENRPNVKINVLFIVTSVYI